jgi:glucose 1-dehydrogenase
MKLKDKAAIVTGAGQGIGLEISRKLAGAGARIVLNDLDSGLAQKAADLITQEKGTCIPVPGDSSEHAVINQLVNAAVSGFGKLDIVVANAGITVFGDFFTYTQESFNKVLRVNLEGTFFLAQAAAIQMRKQQSGGTMLFTSSAAGHQAHKDLSAYGMSKAAIEFLAKNLVIELSPYRINVNAIAPGATLTERTLEDPNYESIWSQITPMGRAASVADIAAAALFLVSDDAKHITGQTLLIDGGWTSTSPSPY